jgi:hypothetical protein
MHELPNQEMPSAEDQDQGYQERSAQQDPLPILVGLLGGDLPSSGRFP